LTKFKRFSKGLIVSKISANVRVDLIQSAIGPAALEAL